MLALDKFTPPIVDDAVKLSYNLQGWCGSCQPFDDMKNPPEQLLSLGMTSEEWQTWTSKLHQVNKMQGGVLCDMSCCLLAATFFCFSCCFCKHFKNETMNIDTKLREWQQDFNNVNGPKYGVFVKSFSYCWVYYEYVDGRQERRRVYDRWFQFAYSPEDIEKLKNTPHLSGVPDNYSYCCGVNEADCCVHP